MFVVYATLIGVGFVVYAFVSPPVLMRRFARRNGLSLFFLALTAATG